VTHINRRFWLHAARFIHHGGRALTALPLLVIYAVATILESAAHALDIAAAAAEKIAAVKPNIHTLNDERITLYGDSSSQTISSSER
jgi:hypothetical protein